MEREEKEKFYFLHKTIFVHNTYIYNIHSQKCTFIDFRNIHFNRRVFRGGPWRPWPLFFRYTKYKYTYGSTKMLRKPDSPNRQFPENDNFPKRQPRNNFLKRKGNSGRDRGGMWNSGSLRSPLQTSSGSHRISSESDRKWPAITGYWPEVTVYRPKVTGNRTKVIENRPEVAGNRPRMTVYRPEIYRKSP